jgi:hypothetical protein
VADGVVGQPVVLRPGGGVTVQLRHALGLLSDKAGAEQVGEQLVVAPPAPHLIQRHQKQVGPLHLLEQLLAVAAATDRVTQRPRQPLQHRRLQQKLPQRVWLAVQDLLGQVVQHIPVAAAELVHKAGRVGVAPQRQGRQLQPGRPPFGALLQRRHGSLGQLRPDGRVEQLGGLLRGEAQVGFAQFGQLPAGAQPRQRQRRVGAAGQHQPQRPWQVLQQQPQRGVHRRRLDQVVVVQHQHQLVGYAGQLVDQRRHHRLQRGGLQVGKQRARPLGNPRAHPVQRGDHVPPEPRHVVVALVQRQPGHRPLATADPVAKQAGLAKAGRGADQDQLACHPLGHARQQPRAWHKPRPRARHVQLGRQQRIPRRPGGPRQGRRGRLGHRYSPPSPVRRRQTVQ